MRPAPPLGAVSAQLPLSWTVFQGRYIASALWLGPRPSLWPTMANLVGSAEVQSPQVLPGSRVPSRFVPVRMSCSLGVGEPAHWPLIFAPFSSRNTSASPKRSWRLVRSAATSTSLALYQGPVPMRSRAWMGASVGPFSALR